MYHQKKPHSSTSPDHNPAFTQPKYATFGKRGRNRWGNISTIARRRKAKRQKKSAPRKSGARKKMPKDSMICRREGKRARFASGLARTPLLSRHIVLRLRRHARALSCSFGLPSGVCLFARARIAPARARATCPNKHTYYCQTAILG